MEPKDRINFALDVDNPDDAKALVSEIGPHVGRIKIGLELITAIGVPAAVQLVHNNGGKVFADLKLNDIPKTVAGASRAITRHGVSMFNMHALSGPAAMAAASDAVDEVMTSVTAPPKRPVVLAVTILTSLNFEALNAMGILRPDADPRYMGIIPDFSEEETNQFVRELVVGLALLTKKSGLDGVIASPLEAKEIRHACGDNFQIITPGVRPTGADIEDQERVATPYKTIRDGADGIVVGSPIRKAKDRVDAAKRIAEEIDKGLNDRNKT